MIVSLSHPIISATSFWSNRRSSRRFRIASPSDKTFCGYDLWSGFSTFNRKLQNGNATMRLRVFWRSQAGMPLLAETGRELSQPDLRAASGPDRHSCRGARGQIQGTQQRRTRRILRGYPRAGDASQETSAGTLRRETKMPRQCPDVARAPKNSLQTRLRGSGAPSSRYGRASFKRQGI